MNHDSGATMGDDARKIDAPQSFPTFLRSLTCLIDSDGVLYLEATGTPPLIEDFLREHEAGREARLPGGTLLPKPDVFHVDITPANMQGLASLLESAHDESVPTHVHVYDSSGVVVLQWYDASAGDPLLVRSSVGSAKVAAFCEGIGSALPV